VQSADRGGARVSAEEEEEEARVAGGVAERGKVSRLHAFVQMPRPTVGAVHRRYRAVWGKVQQAHGMKK